MNTKYNLKTVVDKISETSGGTVNDTKRFEGSGDEYLISNVEEQMLLDMGFEFKGYTTYNTAPYYIMGNILAYFDDVVLHVVEETYSALPVEEENKEDKE